MPKTKTISSIAELNSALASASGGETFLLKGGDYGRLGLTSKDFPSTVTIASADPADPATFSGLSVSKVGNLTFDGVVFDYTFKAGDATNLRPFEVRSSHDVTIRNSTFDGDLAHGKSAIDDGYGTGYALSIRGCTDVSIANNEFVDFSRGAIFDGVSGLTVSGNDLHRMSSDGMNFATVQDVLIEGNFMHDFLRSPESGAHPDMIQFWTSGAKSPSGNITIRGNRLDIGDGAWTQSIFMRNEMVDSGGAGKEMFYYNVLIEDNVIANGHLHGITVGETDGLTVRNNTLVHAAGRDAGGSVSGVNLPTIRVATKSTDVTVSDNIATGLSGHNGQAGWTVEGNLLLSPKDYANAFITSTTQPNNGIHDFRARPGGVVDRAGAGAAETQDTHPAVLTAQFDATRADGSLSTWVFDATSACGGKADFPKGTVFLWDFGDGTTATGRVVSHSYAESGRHEARLTVQLPDGRTDGARQEVMADDHHILRLGPGGKVLSDPDSFAPGIAALPDLDLALKATGTALSVSKTQIAKLIGSESFGIDLSLKAASTASAGEVFRLHGSIVASVGSTGELSVQLSTDAGLVKLATTGARLTDKASHDIRIEHSGDTVAVVVDGRVLGSASMTGSLVGGDHDLTFGNPWGKANFAGVVGEFAIDRGTLALPDRAETAILDATWAGDGAVLPPGGTDIPELPDPVPPLPEPLPPVEPVEPELPSLQPIRLDLGDSGIAHRIARADVAAMLGSEAFALDLGLEADSAGARGEVFRIHQSIIATVNAAGEFSVQAFTTAGEVRLATMGAGLADLDPHRVGLTLADGVLSITVDGEVNASTAMTGTLASAGRHDLTFGNPWGKLNFDATLSGFELRVPTGSGGRDEAWTSVSLVAREDGTPTVAVAELRPAEVDVASRDTDAGRALLSELFVPEALIPEDAGGESLHLLRTLPGSRGGALPDLEHLVAMDRFGFLAESDPHGLQI